jgi:uncharacterized protein (DUF2062 family)
MKLAPADISESLLQLLKRGSTPGKLAFTLALGIAIGSFPIFGVTTIFCALVALAFGLSIPGIQVGNYLATPLQLILLIPFLRLGEWMFHAPHLALSPRELLAHARYAPDQTVRAFLLGQWHAIAAWLAVAPLFVLVLTLLLRPLILKLMSRATAGGERSLSHSPISAKPDCYPAES